MLYALLFVVVKVLTRNSTEHDIFQDSVVQIIQLRSPSHVVRIWLLSVHNKNLIVTGRQHIKTE